MTQPTPYHPRAAFFDLDGTLAVDNRPPFEEDVKAIRAFRDRGNKVFLNTGRSPGFLYPSALRIGFDGIVAGAGAYVRVGETVLRKKSLSPAALDRVIRYFSKSGELCLLEGETGMYQVGRWGARAAQWPSVSSYAEFARRFPGQAVTKLTIFGGEDQAIRHMLGEDFSFIRHGDYAEAVPAGCSKSGGMGLVLEALHMDPEDSIAFGDSMNDYDMIEAAGIGVAMGNALDRVKEVADQVTLPFDRGGVARVLWGLMEEEDTALAGQRHTGKDGNR